MNPVKIPSKLICPSCKNEIKLLRDGSGRIKSDDILTMRLITPVYIKPGVVKETKIEVHVCNQCHTILGSGAKM